MYIKIILSAAVIFGCGYAGILLGRADLIRARQLDSLNTALKTLEFNVSCQNARLSDALGEVFCTDKTVEAVFRNMSKHIEKDKGISVVSAWQLALGETEKGLCLKDEDIEIMRGFVSSLGSGDRAAELSNINAARQRLELVYKEARERAVKNSRLYKNCGFLIGAMAVLILL